MQAATKIAPLAKTGFSQKYGQATPNDALTIAET